MVPVEAAGLLYVFFARPLIIICPELLKISVSDMVSAELGLGCVWAVAAVIFCFSTDRLAIDRKCHNETNSSRNFVQDVTNTRAAMVTDKCHPQSSVRLTTCELEILSSSWMNRGNEDDEEFAHWGSFFIFHFLDRDGVWIVIQDKLTITPAW